MIYLTVEKMNNSALSSSIVAAAVNTAEATTNFTIALSPAGHLYLETSVQAGELATKETVQKIQEFWQDDYAVGLLRLGLIALPAEVTPSISFWQEFSREFIAQICRYPDVLEIPIKSISIPAPQDLSSFLEKAPFMSGSEYLNLEVLKNLWLDLNQALLCELANYSFNIQNYFSAYHANWNLVGRVCFHLAENKDNAAYPFAFLATYTTRLAGNSQLQHLPLGRALQEYAGEKNKALLLALLMPIQKAATASSFIKGLVDSGGIFKPLAWSAQDAYKFLKEIHLFESAGVIVRVPNWWNAKKPNRPQVAIAIGKNKAHSVGTEALLDFDVQLALADGEKLSAQEWQEILAAQGNLIKVKGQWVEVDPEKLKAVLDHWRQVQREVAQGGLSFAEGMRLLAGFGENSVVDQKNDMVRDWSAIFAGNWLQEILHSLRNPTVDVDTQLLAVLKEHLQTLLRPYQIIGVRWLWLLYNLKLGGCLADDMGLGKTVQILSLLLLIKYQEKQKKWEKQEERLLPHLIVVPASLLGNWQTEIISFAPSLKFFIAHGSNENLKQFNPGQLSDYDVIFTTYSFLHRLPWLAKTEWNIIVLDEAQLIKNATAKQTHAAKALFSKVRFILTGTPIENNLGDLWSLFDFIASGLLGAQKTFGRYGKKLQEQDDNKSKANFFTALRALVKPYILRRMKSDKTIISDLPDKTELNAYCSLSKQQIGLYQQAVSELAKKLEQSTGIERRGAVLAYLLRLKQICNHPCQWLGYGEYEEHASGKFLRLKELCTAIAAKQEKVLVFTQFREIMPALDKYLVSIFQKEGLILHGGTNVKQRPELVRLFQQEQGPPFFVLSLKAGGTGLNLTNAAHVIHFDRWWNPAVENQASDRVYRIGQKKNVLVHKFICSGTIEEKIDALINDKKTLSREILSSGKEVILTELSNEELLQVVSLDINRVLGEI